MSKSFTVVSSEFPSYSESHRAMKANATPGSGFLPHPQDPCPMVPSSIYAQQICNGYNVFPSVPFCFQPPPFGAFSQPPPYAPNMGFPTGFMPPPPPSLTPLTTFATNTKSGSSAGAGGGGSLVSVSQPTTRRRAGASVAVGAVSAANPIEAGTNKVVSEAPTATVSPSVQPAVIIMGPLTRSRRNRARAAAKAQQRAATAAQADEDDFEDQVKHTAQSQTSGDQQKGIPHPIDDSGFSVATSASPANTNSNTSAGAHSSSGSTSSRNSTPSVVPFVGGHVLSERLPSPVLKVRSFVENNSDEEPIITSKAADSFYEGSTHSAGEEDVTRCSTATNIPTPSLMACDLGASVQSSFIHAPTLQHLATSIKRNNSFPDDCSVLTAAGDSCILHSGEHEFHFDNAKHHGESESFSLFATNTAIPTAIEGDNCGKAAEKATKAAEKNRLRRLKQRTRKHFGRLAAGVLNELEDEMGDDVESSPASKMTESPAAKAKTIDTQSHLLPSSFHTVPQQTTFHAVHKPSKDEEDAADILRALQEQIAADLIGDVEVDEDKEGSKGLSDSGSRFQTPSPPSEGDTKSITSAFSAPALMSMLSQGNHQGRPGTIGTGKDTFSKVISKPHYSTAGSQNLRNIYTAPLPPPPRGVILHSGQMLKNILRPSLQAGAIEGPASLRTVHIRFIPPYMSQGQLRADLLQPFGPILRVRVCANTNPNEPQDVVAKFAYAFVECATPQQAATMITTLSNLIVTPKDVADAHSLTLHQLAGSPGLARETPIAYNIYTKGSFNAGAGTTPFYPPFPLHLNGSTSQLQMRLKATLSEQTIVDITPSDGNLSTGEVILFDNKTASNNQSQSAFGLGCLSDVTIAAAVLQHRFYKRLSVEKRTAVASYPTGNDTLYEE